MHEQARLHGLDLPGFVGVQRVTQQGETLGATLEPRVDVAEICRDQRDRGGDLPVAGHPPAALE